MPGPAPTQIKTSQALSRRTPAPGEASVGHLRGGPEILLDWLEIQLGLAGSGTPHTDRVTRYAALLDEAGLEVCARSFEADRWATAAELLARRDELRMAGWDGSDDPGFPMLVRDLATVEATGEVPPGLPDRLEAVLEVLESGQSLPEHRLVIEDNSDAWPPLWREVLSQLETREASQPEPQAPAGTALERAQAGLLGETGHPDGSGPPADRSSHALEALSEHEACQVVAAMLARERREEGDLSSTVVYAPDDSVADLLDGALGRLGVPTMGADRDQGAQPALQVLPLVVEMLWKPVDPHVVLDFLSLPVSPIPRHVAGKLAKALSEQPGLGSAEWEKARAECTDPESDPDGRISEKLERWFDHDRVAVGEPVPADRIEDRCRSVAQWARGYAEALADDDGDEDGEGDRSGDGAGGGSSWEALVEALRTAATQASALGDLAATQGGTLTKPQVVRMLEDVRAAGARSQVHPSQAGGPVLVRSLADVPETCERLIWLGTGLEEEPTSRWTHRQRQALADHDVELDDGSRGLQAERAAQRRGLARVGEAVLVVRLPSDAARRPHPLWIQLGEVLSLERDELPPLAEAVEAGDGIGPWAARSRSVDAEPPQPERPLWEIPAELLAEPGYTSNGEMSARLGCPIKWVFRRVARIKASDEATLPGEFRLKGSFCHQVLERVFGDGGDPPPVDEAVAAVGRCFDDRVGRDAAPLARPENLDDRRQVRDELQRATRVLVRTLHDGDHRIVGMEHEIDAEIDGRPLYGWIDSVVEAADGSLDDEAIIDFKYGGSSKYPGLLEDGRALQLAVYAAGRAAEADADEMPDVAYLILSEGRLYTPEGSAIDGAPSGARVHGAPSIGNVWGRFRKALQASRDWLEGEAPVPARPLQDQEEWPSGADLVIDTDESGKDRRPCQYCDYDALCGLRRCE